MKSAVRFAEEVLAMEDEIYRLRAENKRLLEVAEKYGKLLNSSLNHAQTMAGNQLRLMLTPGVAEAMQKDADKKKAAKTA